MSQMSFSCFRHSFVCGSVFSCVLLGPVANYGLYAQLHAETKWFKLQGALCKLPSIEFGTFLFPSSGQLDHPLDLLIPLENNAASCEEFSLLQRVPQSR